MDEHLSVPSTSVVASSCSSTSGVQGTRGVSCPTLANSELVPNVIGTLQDEPVPASDESFSSSMDFEGFSDQRSGTILEPSRLGTIRNALKSGLSPDALRLVDMAHRDSTKRQYQAVWTKFLNYLDINSIDKDKVTLSVVMNFLSYHAIHMKRKYRTIAAYKCALEVPLKSHFGLEFDSPNFKLFMRGVFNADPPQKSSPMPLWSLNDLLDYLNCDIF